MEFNEFSQGIESQLTRNHAEFHINVPAATSIAAAGTYYKANGTTSTDELVGFSDGGSNRLVCDDPIPKKYLVLFSVSGFVASGSVTGNFTVNKNGTVDVSSMIQRVLGASNAPELAANHLIIELVKDDFVEIVLANNNNTQNITLTKMNLTIIQI